jgi:PadR family transcriptional regulator
MAWPFRVTAPLLDVVEVLLNADGELHGWQIMKETGRTGATVYQVLERLRKARWVDSRWEEFPEPSAADDQVTAIDDMAAASIGRPRRRYYRISGEGAAKGPILLAERRPRKAYVANPRPVYRLQLFFGGGR